MQVNDAEEGTQMTLIKFVCRVCLLIGDDYFRVELAFGLSNRL